MVMDTTSCRNQPTNDAAVTLPAAMLKEFRGIAIQHLSFIELEIPGEENQLHSPQQEDWVDWPSLETDLIDLMTSKLQAGTATEPDHWWTLRNQTGWLDVRVNHMIDDYWWVECLPVSLNDSGQLETDADQVPAPAVLRIQGSRNHLPYTPDKSAKLTGSP